MDLSLRSIRRGVAAFAVVAIMASMLAVNVANAQVGPFTDVNPTDWFAGDVQWGLDEGVLNPAMTTFRPGDNASRAEFTAMVVRYKGLLATNPDPKCDPSLFSDVDATHPLCEEVTAAARAGIVSGYGAGHPQEGNFGPNDQIDRAAAAKILVEGFGLASDPLIIPATLGSDQWTDAVAGTWYDLYMGMTWDNCVFRGDGSSNYTTVRPGSPINRAESIATVHRAAVIDLSCHVEEVTPGALTVSLDGASPEGTSVPRNADLLMGVFAFDAAQSDAEVTGLKFHLEGLNDLDDIDRVRLEQNGFTLADRSVNPEGIAQFSSVGLEVSEGTQTSLELVAALLAAENSELSFCLNAPEDVTAVLPGTTTPVTVGGTFPICTGTFRTTSSTVGQLTYEIDDYAGDLNVGETDNLMRLDLDVNNREGVYVNSFTFKNMGSADSTAFDSWKILAGVEELAYEATWNGDYVTFVLTDPYLIPKSSSRVFLFSATIVGGIGETVLFDVDNLWDIKGMGEDTQYGVKVVETLTPPAIAPRDILGGDLSIAFTGKPTVGTVSQGDEKDLAILNFVTAGDGVTVNDLTLQVCYDGAAVNYNELSDVKLGVWNETTSSWDILTGPESPTAGVIAPPPAVCATLTYNDSFDLPAGSTTQVHVLTDIADAAANGAIYWARFDTSTVQAEFTSDGTNLLATDIAGGVITGNKQTVADPTLTATLAATPGNRNIVAGTTGLEVADWNIQASTADDLTVTSITFTCNYTDTIVDGDDCRNVFGNLELHLLSGLPSAPTMLQGGKSFSAGASGTVTFNNLDDGDTVSGLNIPAGKTIKVALMTDSSKSGDATDFGQFLLNGAASIEVQDSEAQTLTAAQKIISILPRTLTLTGSGVLSAVGVTDATTIGRILIGDSTANPTMKVRFSASNDEPWIINDLTVVAHNPMDPVPNFVTTTPAAEFNSADNITGWVANNGGGVVQLPANISAAQGTNSVGINTTVIGTSNLSYDRGALAPVPPVNMLTSAVISYYVLDNATTANAFTAQFVESDLSDLNAASANKTTVNLNAGLTLKEGEWVSEVVSIPGGIDRYYGILITGTGVAADAADTLFVDSLELHTVDPTQDTPVSEVYAKYTDEAGNTQTATTSMVGGLATFNDLEGWVPMNGNMTMEIGINVGSVGTLGAAAGDQVKLLASVQNFEAQGASSNILRTGYVMQASNDFRVANNAPVVKKESANTDITASPAELLAFSVTPINTTRGLAVKQFVVNVATVGVSVQDLELYKNGVKYAPDANVKIEIVGGPDVKSPAAVAFGSTDVMVQIDCGTSCSAADDVGTGATYMLKATVNGAGPGTSVSTKLLKDPRTGVLPLYNNLRGNIYQDASSQLIDFDTTLVPDGVGDNDANFVWADYSLTNNAEIGNSSTDWMNGWLVEGLDTISSHQLTY